MKKTLLIIFGSLLSLILLAAVLPFLFKDKIVARIDQEITQSVDAEVIYDLNNISLSLFRRFPNVSVVINDMAIVGHAPFAGDTLVSLKELAVDLNLKSVIFDEHPSLTGVALAGGSLYVKVLEDGQANYNITYPDTTGITQEESNFQIGINQIQVSDLNLVYDDRQLDYFMALGNIEAEGSGEFTASTYDLPIQLSATIADISYDGVSYLSNKSFEGETDLLVDMDQMKFTLGEGNFKLNDFLFDLSGYLAMPNDPIEMDLTFGSKDNDFKKILSLVPGIYTESFSSLETSGTMDFKGSLKGIYDDNSFPAFDIYLKVADGMFKYPDLPKPVKNINLNLELKNATNQIENTSVNLSDFRLDFGSNPISGRFLLSNLKDYNLDAGLNGKLDLQELTSIFPIEGMELKGRLEANLEAKGQYDSIAGKIPAINAKLNLADGYVKSQEYSAPIENLNILANIQNASGKMNDFSVDLDRFGFILEGESIRGKMKIRDFENLFWDGEIAGAVDLKKVTAIFPVEGMELTGKIKADILTKGSYAAVEAKKYNQLTNSGTLDLSNFSYVSVDVPQGVLINKAHADFSPERINLTEFDSKLGESPVQATGYLSNYMDYLLGENGVLKGQLSLTSPKFNVNEWMTESATDTAATEMTVIELPQNVNFSMNVAANEVLYDNLNLKNVKGNMELRDGILSFSDASMQTMGGTIGMTGQYDPRDLKAPKFDFNLNVAELKIAEAFQAFNTIKAFAPIAQNLTGTFSTNLKFSGNLGQDMMPILSSLDAAGLLSVVQTALQESKILQGITSLTKLQDTNTLQIRNISIPISIHDGMMDVKPFDVKLWDYQAKIQGTAGFDGSMNYLLQMEVPAGKFGAQANALLASISGAGINENTKIPIAFNLTGSYQSPKVSLAGGNSMETLLADALKARVSGESKAIQEQAQAQFAAVQDSLKQEMKAKAVAAQDSIKKELEKQGSQVKDKAAEEAKKLLKGFLPKATTKPDTTIKNNP